MDSLSLLELNSLVRRSLEQCLPDEYWIQAELSDVRSNTTGHCYLEFVQKDPRSNNLVAKARGMIWNNIYRLLKPYFEESTGQLFTSGIKVLVKVTVQFHELYGYSLTVLDIDPAYTLGDMARRRREILLQLEEEGVLTLNKELEMPVLPQRVAVISSATAAGYGDFCHQLQHNPGGFYFYTELFPALMQGNQVEESVLAALQSQFVSKQYMTNAEVEELTLDKYFVSNLNLAYSFRPKKVLKEVTVGFTVYNLFNEKYENNGWASSDYTDTVENRGNYAGYAAQAGTNVMGHVSFRF